MPREQGYGSKVGRPQKESKKGEEEKINGSSEIRNTAGSLG